MNKRQLAELILEFGDAIITYKSEVSGKLKYNVCTLDLSTPYIQGKINRAKETEDTILTFSWDTDSFRLIKCKNVVKVESLAVALRRSRG